MRTRPNSRNTDLASVSPDKAAEDSFNMSGLFAQYAFFDKATKNTHKVALDSMQRWIYEESKSLVANGKYMYVVGSNGALYIGNPLVHSQFKAGKDVQTGGWLDYKRDEMSQEMKISMDNCSGHYTPSLSQTLLTWQGLCLAKFLPPKFNVKLSKFTRITPDEHSDFWEAAKNNSINAEESLPILVDVFEQTGEFLYTINNSQTCLMQAHEAATEKQFADLTDLVRCKMA